MELEQEIRLEQFVEPEVVVVSEPASDRERVVEPEWVRCPEPAAGPFQAWVVVAKGIGAGYLCGRLFWKSLEDQDSDFSFFSFLLEGPLLHENVLNCPRI